MTGEQFGGILRTLLAFLAGFLPATFMDPTSVSAIIGGIVAIGVALWSYYSKPPATPTPLPPPNPPVV